VLEGLGRDSMGILFFASDRKSVVTLMFWQTIFFLKDASSKELFPSSIAWASIPLAAAFFSDFFIFQGRDPG